MTKRHSELLNKLQLQLQWETGDYTGNSNNNKEKVIPWVRDFIKFIYADVYVSLKAVLCSPYKNRSVYSLNSEIEFYQLINRLSTRRVYPYLTKPPEQPLFQKTWFLWFIITCHAFDAYISAVYVRQGEYSCTDYGPWSVRRWSFWWMLEQIYAYWRAVFLTFGSVFLSFLRQEL